MLARHGVGQPSPARRWPVSLSVTWSQCAAAARVARPPTARSYQACPRRHRGRCRVVTNRVAFWPCPVLFAAPLPVPSAALAPVRARASPGYHHDFLSWCCYRAMTSEQTSTRRPTWNFFASPTVCPLRIAEACVSQAGFQVALAHRHRASRPASLLVQFAAVSGASRLRLVPALTAEIAMLGSLREKHFAGQAVRTQQSRTAALH